MRRATTARGSSCSRYRISIHALREESDLIRLLQTSLKGLFQSTLSVRRATTDLSLIVVTLLISIHALREESDLIFQWILNLLNYFNPRSPWGERLFIFLSTTKKSHNFNPRSPWGERLWYAVVILPSFYFNPRSPWGERLATLKTLARAKGISIHALREESDDSTSMLTSSDRLFQSTLSVRRATRCLNRLWKLYFLFQSTLSVRRATDNTSEIIISSWFQSTLSVRRATTRILLYTLMWQISIHALREESDEDFVTSGSTSQYFNPRSPWGERQPPATQPTMSKTISIHALREESDDFLTTIVDFRTLISIHALREESDNSRYLWLNRHTIFQSTLSVRRATGCGRRLFRLTHEFQSTLSVRRATSFFVNKYTHTKYFNPRSPWGERLFYFCHFYPP